jgi:hypothetical protein
VVSTVLVLGREGELMDKGVVEMGCWGEKRVKDVNVGFGVLVCVEGGKRRL